jgi:hypothetical protein
MSRRQLTKQEMLYFALWRDACAVTGWKVSERAARMAFHKEVLGEEISSKQFTNAHYDRIFARLKLIIRPGDGQIRREVDRYESGDPTLDMGERRRQLTAIQRLATAIVTIQGESAAGSGPAWEAYVRRITLDQAGETINFMDVVNDDTHIDLDNVRKTLKNRLGTLLTHIKDGEIPWIGSPDLRGVKNNNSFMGEITRGEVVLSPTYEEEADFVEVTDEDVEVPF